MQMRARLSATIMASAFALGTGCATYREQLARSQHAFEQNDHERALALLRDLERDVPRLNGPEQAQYAYVRGMTDYRIGYRAEARHWLSIAVAHDEMAPGTLPTDWKARATTALDELNVVLHAEGFAALHASKGPIEDAAEAPNKNLTPRGR